MKNQTLTSVHHGEVPTAVIEGRKPEGMAAMGRPKACLTTDNYSLQVLPVREKVSLLSSPNPADLNLLLMSVSACGEICQMMLLGMVEALKRSSIFCQFL